MTKTTLHDDNYFIKNAVLCWLHHYGDQGHKWDSIYKELAQRNAYTSLESNDEKPKPRPARRRKPKASTNT